MEQRKLWDLLEYERLVSAKVSGEEFELGDKLWGYLNDYAEAFGIPSDEWGLAEWRAMPPAKTHQNGRCAFLRLSIGASLPHA